jgi:hypothetical protein
MASSLLVGTVADYFKLKEISGKADCERGLAFRHASDADLRYAEN